MLINCNGGNNSSGDPLPIIPKLDKETGQAIEHTIRPFSFMNQDSQIVTNATFKDKIYIADFFFIHCPIICPKVKANTKFLYDELKDNKDVLFLSHAIDTKYDTIPALKEYANKLQIETDRWHLVTGNRKELHDIDVDYVSSVKIDPDAPGGLDHSGYLVLIDKKGHVRSFARGTEREGAEKLLKDVKRLLKEYE